MGNSATSRSVPGAPACHKLESLAARFRDPLVRYFVRRGVAAQEAEDYAQDTLLRLAGADISRLDNPEGYLFSIAASVVIDRSRRAKSRSADQHVPLDDLGLPCGGPTPARVFESKADLLRLAAALDALSARTREIFLLNRLDTLTYTQIAARYGIGVGAIEKHMTKALTHIRKTFQDD